MYQKLCLVWQIMGSRQYECLGKCVIEISDNTSRALICCVLREHCIERCYNLLLNGNGQKRDIIVIYQYGGMQYKYYVSLCLVLCPSQQVFGLFGENRENKTAGTNLLLDRKRLSIGFERCYLRSVLSAFD